MLCTRDQHDVVALREEPCQRHLSRRCGDLLGDHFNGVHDTHILLEVAPSLAESYESTPRRRIGTLPPGMTEGREGLKAATRALRTAVPNLKPNLDLQIAGTR